MDDEDLERFALLLEAVKGNQEDRVKELLDERPCLATLKTYDSRTALHIAGSEGRVDIAELLIRFLFFRK